MKAKPECIACMLKQALNTARVVTDDEALQREVMARAARCMSDPSLDQTPAALSQPAYEIVAEVTGVADPYAAAKRESNTAALALLPDCRRWLAEAEDPLDMALHIAAAGNVIDLGIGHAFDMERDLHALLKQRFAITALDRFRAELRPGCRLLYLGDNAGEIVFDTLLVKCLIDQGVAVTYTVKSGPIINDAMRADAQQVGMTDLCPVIETGSSDIGVNWDHLSPACRDHVARADIILGKGHGNFETCSDRPENFYFLLKAKCEVVAAELGVRLGDTVFKHVTGRDA